MAQALDAAQLRRVSELLEIVLTLDPAERNSWLDRLEGDDAELRGMVAELLGRTESIDGPEFLATLPRLGALDDAPRARELTTRDEVGPYRLERELGYGGMGTVWLAERVDKTLKRKVALKLPHTGGGHRQLAQRLARERDILSALEHPNIARLYDAGVSENGQPYLAIEYVEGLRIDQYAEEHALDVRQCLELFLQVCRAVSYAHSHLVLHRDLKPSNILVTEAGEVRLLDFGIAKLLQEGTTADTELTRLGGHALTPEYASPEQISGKPLTTASDIYSLGVVLFELVCGQRPYRSKRDSLGAREEAVLQAEAPRPSRLAAGDRRRAISGDVDTIILKTLEKEPSARFPTVNAVIEDIQRHLNGEPVLARPSSAWYRARKFVRRNRVLVGAATAVALSLILGAIGALWQARLARQQAQRAEASAADARFAARVARGSHEFLGQIFSDAMKNSESPAMRARLDRAREFLNRVYADEPVIHANLLLELAGRYDELGLQDREDEVMSEYRKLAEKTGDASLLANQECIDAYDALSSGDVAGAKPHVQKGLALMASSQASLTDVDFECLRADAMLSMTTGDSAHAVAQMQRLLKRLEADKLDKTRLYLSSLDSFAYVYSLGGFYVEALDAYRREAALHEVLGSAQTLGAYINRARQSNLLYVLGRINEAFTIEDRLAEDFRSSEGGGKVPPDLLLGFGSHALFANELARGRQWVEEALERFTATGPPGAVIASYLLLADASLRTGKVDEANASITTATQLAEKAKLVPTSRLRTHRLRLALAALRADAGAVKTELQALETDLAALPNLAHSTIRATVLETQLEAGSALLAVGDLDGAAHRGGEVLKLAQSSVLPAQGDAWVGAAKLLLGRIRLAQGEAKEAAALAKEATVQFVDTLSETHPLRVAAQQLAQKAVP